VVQRPGPTHRADARDLLTRAVLVVLSALLASSGCASYAYLAPELIPVPPEELEVPDLSNRSTLRIVVLGDAGTGGDRQRDVGEAMRDVCALPDIGACDLALVGGDNIYAKGVRGVDDTQFQEKFEAPYRDLGNLPFWLLPGNHDWRRPESVQAEIDYSRRSPRWRMPHNYYPVPGLPAWLRVYGLDTTVIFDLARENEPVKVAALERSRDEQLSALESALCPGGGWKLLFAHHPVYSSGPHALEGGQAGVAPEILATLEPLIQRCGIQIFFAGHDHHQEHIRADGFEQITQGAGGRGLRDLARGLPDAASRTGYAEHGFALVTIEPESVEVVFYGADRGGAARRLYGWDATLADYR
jgi:acid phosphatase